MDQALNIEAHDKIPSRFCGVVEREKSQQSKFQSSVIALESPARGLYVNSIHWIPSSNDPQVLLWGIR